MTGRNMRVTSKHYEESEYFKRKILRYKNNLKKSTLHYIGTFKLPPV